MYKEESLTKDRVYKKESLTEDRVNKKERLTRALEYKSRTTAARTKTVE